MLSLELGGKRYPVAAGEITIGSDDTDLVPLGGEGVVPRHVIIQGWADGSAAVRPIGDAEVRVNGVRLGTDPIPLLHGDKLNVSGHEILVVDQKRAGRTQVFTAVELPTGAAVTGAPARAMMSGRIVSLADGREYQIGERPVVFGRDASSDIVVPGSDVSRRHAEVHPRGDGYILIDTSVNGTYVRGDRVSGEVRLGRGDVIRMGNEEFRFYADAAPESPPSSSRRRCIRTITLHATSRTGSTFQSSRRSPAGCTPPAGSSRRPRSGPTWFPISSSSGDVPAST